MRIHLPKILELAIGTHIKGWIHECHCGTRFLARKDAKYCSDPCAMKAYRERKKNPE